MQRKFSASNVMFTRRRICCVLAIFERRRGRLGSKISGCGQLAEATVYFAMSDLRPGSRHQSEGSACPLGAATFRPKHLQYRMCTELRLHEETQPIAAFKEPARLRHPASISAGDYQTLQNHGRTANMPMPSQIAPRFGLQSSSIENGFFQAHVRKLQIHPNRLDDFPSPTKV
jgi:hypothetical protein